MFGARSDFMIYGKYYEGYGLKAGDNDLIDCLFHVLGVAVGDYYANFIKQLMRHLLIIDAGYDLGVVCGT